jgi:hypothetical protein
MTNTLILSNASLINGLFNNGVSVDDTITLNDNRQQELQLRARGRLPHHAVGCHITR